MDGAQQWHFTDTAGAALIDGPNDLRFFQDQKGSGATGEESARTIEGHLEKAYRKLGVVGRHELAPLLGLEASAATASIPPGSNPRWTGRGG